MSTVKTNVTDLKKWQQQIDKLEKGELDKLLQKATVRICAELDQRLRTDKPNKVEATETVFGTPVITGNLRNSWNMGSPVKVNNEWQISEINSAEYAPYVENGHFFAYKNKEGKIVRTDIWVEGQHFQQEAENYIQNNRAEKIIESILDKGLNKK